MACSNIPTLRGKPQEMDNENLIAYFNLHLGLNKHFDNLVKENIRLKNFITEQFDKEGKCYIEIKSEKERKLMQSVHHGEKMGPRPSPPAIVRPTYQQDPQVGFQSQEPGKEVTKFEGKIAALQVQVRDEMRKCKKLHEQMKDEEKKNKKLQEKVKSLEASQRQLKEERDLYEIQNKVFVSDVDDIRRNHRKEKDKYDNTIHHLEFKLEQKDKKLMELQQEMMNFKQLYGIR